MQPRWVQTAETTITLEVPASVRITSLSLSKRVCDGNSFSSFTSKAVSLLIKMGVPFQTKYFIENNWTYFSINLLYLSLNESNFVVIF